jgi:hypothetical protein
LDDATQVIDTLTIQYVKYLGRVKNAVGQWISSYATPVDVQASVQAVPRTTYNQLGLDLQKQYVNVFVSLDVTDLDRDVSGDQFILPDGRRYQLESQTDWYGIDGGFQGGIGWVGPLLCVAVDYKQ